VGKSPASQFYWGDLRRDVEYHLMSFESRGIWMEMLCCMWDSRERGKIEGSPDQIASLLGCSVDKFKSAIKEIDVTKTGDVTESNGFVTVINRRMFREQKERILTRLRVEKFRNKHQIQISNKNITPPSSSSSSFSNKNITQLFDEFWKIYPPRNGRKLTKKESLQFFKDNFKEEDQIRSLLEATKNYSKSGKEGFIRDPIRFLKKDFWKDWIESEKVDTSDDPYSNFEIAKGE
jgi:hypothetical protein